MLHVVRRREGKNHEIRLAGGGVVMVVVPVTVFKHVGGEGGSSSDSYLVNSIYLSFSFDFSVKYKSSIFS